MDGENLKQKLVAHALTGVLTALGGGLLVALPIAENYLVQYAQILTPLAIVRVITVLTATVCLALAFALYNRPKLKFSQIDGGVWIDLKTDIRYCPSCKTKKILSPLNDANDEYWHCPVRDCQMAFKKKRKYP